MDVERLTRLIIETLRASPTPLSARGLMRQIGLANDFPCNTSEINKILYKGPFEKIVGDEAAPTWKLREDVPDRPELVPYSECIADTIPLMVEGVGVFYLEPSLSDYDLEVVLRAVAACVPGGQGVLLHEASAGGKRVAGLADNCGFAEAREAQEAQEAEEVP